MISQPLNQLHLVPNCEAIGEPCPCGSQWLILLPRMIHPTLSVLTSVPSCTLGCCGGNPGIQVIGAAPGNLDRGDDSYWLISSPQPLTSPPGPSPRLTSPWI